MDAGFRGRVAAARVARLATVRPSGAPHVVPVTFALDGNTIVTAIDHKPKATTDLQRLANLRANPAASVLVDHYDDDWTRLWWARADGRGRILEDGPERDRAIALLVAKYAPYRDAPPAGPAIAVAVSRWATWEP